MAREPAARRAAAVVGAGVFGLAAAWELRRRGWDVLLLDPGPVPHPDAASTDVSKAVRMDYGSDAHYTAWMEATFPRWDAWNRLWPRPLYHQDGFLLLSRQALRPGGFEHDSRETLAARGHPTERIGPAELRARYPAWNPALYPEGYLNRRAGWAESAAVTAWMREEAVREGVRLLTGPAFAGLLEAGSRVAGIRDSAGGRHPADRVVVAAGAWTPSLLPHLGGVMWATGQPVLRFRPGQPDLFRAVRFPVWGADIARTGFYGFPLHPDGTVKVGNHGPGRRVDPTEPRAVAPDDEERFREFLRGTFPAMAGAPCVDSRLCLYCDTFDGDFWIDHDPDRPGLVVAAGDSGHGFKFAPTLGPLIADVVEGRPNSTAGRFRWRSPGEEIRREAARYAGGPSPT